MARRGWLLLLAALVITLGYRKLRRGSPPGILGMLRRMPSARLYDPWSRLFLGGLYDHLARQVAASHQVGTVLDVGSGPGWLDIRLAQLAPDLSIVGVDIDPEMVSRASAHADLAGVDDRLRFRVADSRKLPFDDGEFDLVISSFAAHHWEDASRGMGEIHRVLKPGGEARIYDLPDWALRLHGTYGSLSRLGMESPFAGGIVFTVRWPDRLPSVQCLLARKETERDGPDQSEL